MVQRRFVGFAVVLAGVAATACGSSILGTDVETGIEVLVMRGPLRPVAMEGEVNEEPVRGATVRVRGATGGGGAEAVTSADGLVALSLLPGEYRVDVIVCPGALSLPGEAPVSVEQGSIAAITLNCDTGIR